MSDSLITFLYETLSATEKVTFSHQQKDDSYGIEYTVHFEAKAPAPDNKAVIDLSEIFAAFPNGFVIESITDLNSVRNRMAYGHVFNGTFKLRVTAPVDDVEPQPVPETFVDDALANFRTLPPEKQTIFIESVNALLKGLSN